MNKPKKKDIPPAEYEVTSPILMEVEVDYMTDKLEKTTAASYAATNKLTLLTQEPSGDWTGTAIISQENIDSAVNTFYSEGIFQTDDGWYVEKQNILRIKPPEPGEYPVLCEMPTNPNAPLIITGSKL